jgi:hypothetical protein
MGLINDFLSRFGVSLDRRPTHYTARPATTAETIGAKFMQDALRHQSESCFYFHKGLAPPRQTFADRQFNNYLRDGSAPPPPR